MVLALSEPANDVDALVGLADPKSASRQFHRGKDASGSVAQIQLLYIKLVFCIIVVAAEQINETAGGDEGLVAAHCSVFNIRLYRIPFVFALLNIINVNLVEVLGLLLEVANYLELALRIKLVVHIDAELIVGRVFGLVARRIFGPVGRRILGTIGRHIFGPILCFIPSNGV